MIGIDIVSITRVERVFMRYGERFLEHFLLPSEIDLLRFKDFALSSIAGFWAAKEACAKALGVGIGQELRFFDMCISYTQTKAPLIVLPEEKMQAFGIISLALSISHDGGFAIAAVIAESSSRYKAK